MKTLTITDAKKNLGRLLSEAARGEDIGIVSGADIIALRKVEVESTDYAYRELNAFEKAAEERFRKMKHSGKLISKTPQQLTVNETRPKPSQTIGSELRKLREAKGIKQSFIRAKLGLSSGQVSLLEADLRTWKPEWIDTYRKSVGA